MEPSLTAFIRQYVRGPYATSHVSRNRRQYNVDYYRRHRKRILAQHRLNYIVKKGKAQHGIHG